MSFLSNLFKKKTAKPTVGIDEQMANEQDAQAAHAKQIEEKIEVSNQQITKLQEELKLIQSYRNTR